MDEIIEIEHHHELPFLIRELSNTHSASLHRLVQGNKNRLKRFFPITVSATETIAQTKKYITNKKKLRSKNVIILGVFVDIGLAGVIFIKSIDWKIPKCELAYFIDGKHEGKGLISNAIKEVVSFCFKRLNMNKIFMRIDPNNISSIRVAVKNDFMLEGTLRNEFKIETGDLIDLCYYGKLQT